MAYFCRSLCDSSIPCSYYSLSYACKPEKVEGPAAKYYITGTDEYSKYLINKLSLHCNLQRINIPIDRYFTSISLTTWALEKNITIVGTIKYDRKGIPKELKPVADREERSAMHVYNTRDKIMFFSYIDKKENGKKNILVLSTMHDNVKNTKGKPKKPSVHTMYDHTRGDVDVVDLLSTTHSTQIKSRWWSLNAFTFILDTCRSNAKTFVQDNDIKLTNF